MCFAVELQSHCRIFCNSFARSSDFLRDQRTVQSEVQRGTDFFIFFLSADLGAIIEYEDLRTRINPIFREDYLAVFVVLLTMCILFVIVSGLTQRKLEAWREQEHRKASWRYNPADRFA